MDSRRELILAALATALNAVRSPYALEYSTSRVVSVTDDDDVITSDYDNDLHSMSVMLSAVDVFDESTIERSKATNALLAWLQQGAVADRALGGLCEDIRLTRAYPVYSESPSHFIAAIVEATITYRTAPDNPFVAAP